MSNTGKPARAIPLILATLASAALVGFAGLLAFTAYYLNLSGNPPFSEFFSLLKETAEALLLAVLVFSLLLLMYVKMAVFIVYKQALHHLFYKKGKTRLKHHAIAALLTCIVATPLWFYILATGFEKADVGLSPVFPVIALILTIMLTGILHWRFINPRAKEQAL